MSISRRRQRRGATSWSVTATPIRCAARRISPPRPRAGFAVPTTASPARHYERCCGNTRFRDTRPRTHRRTRHDRPVEPARRLQRAQHPDGTRSRALLRGRRTRRERPALHRSDRFRRKSLLRRRRSEGAPRHDRRGVDPPASFRADGAGADRLPGPDLGAVNGAAWRRLQSRGLAISSTPRRPRASR